MVAAVVTTRGREASLSILTSGYVPLGPATMILMKVGHNFQQDTDTVADIAGDEIVAKDYERQVMFWDPVLTATDGSTTQSSRATEFGIVGGAVNDTVGGCYMFFDSGVDATSIVTACLQFREPMGTDGTDLVVTPILLVWSLPPF